MYYQRGGAKKSRQIVKLSQKPQGPYKPTYPRCEGPGAKVKAEVKLNGSRTDTNRELVARKHSVRKKKRKGIHSQN